MSTTFTQTVLNKAQTERPWIRKIGPNAYRVVPRTSDHGKYELCVKWEGDEPTVELCVDYRTGEECLGWRYSKQCYHSAALLKHLVHQQGRAV